MVIKIQFYNIAPEGAILHHRLQNTNLVNRAQNWAVAGVRSGEHNLYHSSYTEVYGYLGPVVWPWFSCV